MALVLSGSIDISGSMTATTIVVSSPGAAGMVSSSAQITELVPLMAYTASLKGAAIVSSSQQITNYYKFAETASANTFYGNQTFSSSVLDVIGGGISINRIGGQPYVYFKKDSTDLGSVYGKMGGGLLLYNVSTAVITVNSDNTTTFADNIIMANGKGIDFSATSNGSGTTTSELLDDYEEGTFTATVEGGTTAGTGTYSRQVGVYTKIGNLVTCNVWIQWSAHTGTGDMFFGGFPFTSIGTTNSRFSGFFGYVENLTLSANHMAAIVIVPSSVIASVGQNPVGGGAAGPAVPMDSAANLHFAITYQTT